MSSSAFLGGIARSDSKDPATTCKGVTSNGRPCRRALKISPHRHKAAPRKTARRRASSSSSSDDGDDDYTPGDSDDEYTDSSDDDGVLAVYEEEEGAEAAAAWFCWQHKDQAEGLVARANAAVQKQQQQRQSRTSPQRQQQQQPGGKPAAQGNNIQQGLHRQRSRIVPLKGRSSIDTLVQKLGVLDLDEEEEEAKRAGETPNETRRRREEKLRERMREREKQRKVQQRPPMWDGVQGPLLSVPEDVVMQYSKMQGQQQQHQQAQRPSTARPNSSRPEKPPHEDDDARKHKKKRKHGFLVKLCCSTAAEESEDEIEQYKQGLNRPSHQQMDEKLQAGHQPVTSGYDQHRPPQTSHARPSAQATPTNSSTLPPRRPLNGQSGSTTPSHSSASPAAPAGLTPNTTTALLSWIPKNLPPSTTSALLAELAKPISASDVPGFIYIFWLTDERQHAPSSSAARDILTPYNSNSNATSSSRPAGPGHHPSDVLRTYATGSDQRTVLLKIGRANNVARRMQEWEKQCGYALTLLRFYPYVPGASEDPTVLAEATTTGTTTAAAAGSGARVHALPYAHKVERLIHLELGACRVKRLCAACGREHREWFEVEATRDGVRGVDACVRRWVDWAEEQGRMAAVGAQQRVRNAGAGGGERGGYY